MADIPTNLLYFGDNLSWLREHGKFPDESVDLVYLDPPFNSNRNYNVLFKESDVRESEAQIHEGQWVSDYDGRMYPRIQILCAQDLVDGKRPRMPASGTGLFAKPERERGQEGTQGRLG